MNIHPYAKAVVAVIAAALYALQAALTDGGVTAQEWVGIAVAAVAAVGVSPSELARWLVSHLA